MSSGVGISSLSMLNIQSLRASVAARFFMLPKPSNAVWRQMDTFGYWAAISVVRSVEPLSSSRTSSNGASASSTSLRRRSAFLASMAQVIGIMGLSVSDGQFQQGGGERDGEQDFCDERDVSV